MIPASTSAPAQTPSHAVLASAADWYARLRDGRAESRDRDAWRAWLAADEAHRTAWRQVEEISRGLEPLHDLPSPRRAAQALGVATDRLRARRRALVGVAVLASAGALGGLGHGQGWLPARLLALGADHHTWIGEQQALTLADGSLLWLNTASAVNLRFTDDERVIELVDGEVFIATAEDAGRPFVVDTPHGRLRALGTRFNVRLGAGASQVAVFDGAVEIRVTDGLTGIVRAGRQAGFHTGHIGAGQAADPAREAWTQGALVADDITLREVVAELRRYRRGHLGVADEVAELKVYGNFPIRDAERVLTMLASALPIRIHEPLPWWTRIEARR